MDHDDNMYAWNGNGGLYGRVKGYTDNVNGGGSNASGLDGLNCSYTQSHTHIYI